LNKNLTLTLRFLSIFIPISYVFLTVILPQFSISRACPAVLISKRLFATILK